MGRRDRDAAVRLELADDREPTSSAPWRRSSQPFRRPRNTSAPSRHLTDVRSDAQLLRQPVPTPRRSGSSTTATPSGSTRYHLRRSRDADSAHDLTAETFAQAWLARRRFRDDAGGSAGPWLFAIARHVLLASVRKRRLELAACERLGVLERLDRPPAAAEPDDSWLDGLDEALADLPAGQREAIELRVVDDLDYERVAATLDTTPLAARVRVSRGLDHPQTPTDRLPGGAPMTKLSPTLDRARQRAAGLGRGRPRRPAPLPAAAVRAGSSS